ncbi:MAG: hypothetical protein ACKO5E_21205 [bacterium]
MIDTRHFKARSSLVCTLIFIASAFAHNSQGQGIPSAGKADVPNDQLVVRPPPEPLDDFESDLNPEDGRPDGWYNDRGATLISPGYKSSRALKIENDKAGRPARISRAFGVDGRKFSALRVGAWVHVSNIGHGEHQGEEPSILIDFLSEKLLSTSRGVVGPFNKVTTGEDDWFYVSKTLPVKPQTRDAIMTVGLMGATGVFLIDRLELELIPREASPETNLLLNSGFEQGDLKPDHWVIEGSARRVMGGQKSFAALELGRGTGRALIGLGRMLEGINRLKISLIAKSQGLRSAGVGGVVGVLFFVDERGSTVLNRQAQVPFRFSGTGNWSDKEATIEVPAGAVGAILQFDKIDNAGSLLIDDISVKDADNASTWLPRTVTLAEKADEWPDFQPITAIAEGSVLDTTTWGLSQPSGRISVKNGRLVDSTGKPARLWGVSLLPTAGFPEEERSTKIADNLSRLGVNFVRFGDLDLAYGPGRSLIDDIFENTGELDPVSWARMDRLQKELSGRGIYFSMEMHAHRLFRKGDGFNDASSLPPGGSSAAIFDPKITVLIDQLAQKILKEPRPASGATLAEDPHLAWVTEMGETSMLELENGLFEPTDRQRDILRDLQKKSKSGNTKKFHRELESQRATDFASLLKNSGLKSPIAGSGHWQREPDWLETLSAKNLTVIEDRYYWPFQPWAQPEFRSSLFDTTRSLPAVVAAKRKPDKAYVLAQWCSQVPGGWALPSEAPDLILGAWSARSLDLDVLVRRGLANYPEDWGSAATGTGGDRDIFPLAESLGGMPQALAMLPHVASIMRRDRTEATAKAAPPRPATKNRPVFGKSPIEGWDAVAGLLKVQTAHTVGLAGHVKDATSENRRFDSMELSLDAQQGVIIASSATSNPIATTERILITAIGKAVSTGMRYTDHWQKDIAELGYPPLRIEPVKGQLKWTGNGRIRVFSVDNNGKRGKELDISQTENGQVVELDTKLGGPHWEVTVSKNN